MADVQSPEPLDDTHDPSLRSWVESANVDGCEFPIQNLPLGIFSERNHLEPRVGVAIGDKVLDLRAAFEFVETPASIHRKLFQATTLDPLLSAGRPSLKALRSWLSAMLSSAAGGNRLHSVRDRVLLPISECALQRPTSVPNFADFYAGIEHARRAGAIARPGSTLAANYAWQPLAYNGRASTVGVSGGVIDRPWAPKLSENPDVPLFGPTGSLDFELELGIWVCGQATGAINLPSASRHIAGLCLLNDWSARDIQRWEMTPLGPLLGKSFATTISPWIVTMDALAPFRVPPMARERTHPALLPYLDDPQDRAFGALDIELSVTIGTQRMRADKLHPEIMTKTNARNLYWTYGQMVTHLSVNGCTLLPGELLGTGTVSGPQAADSGSLLELSHGGRHPRVLSNGEHRTYLEDGDQIELRGLCRRAGFASIGFGPCNATVAVSRGP